MINAFSMARHIATRHEAAIGAAMLRHTASRPRVVNTYEERKPRKDPHEQTWLDRAALVRGVIADNPGCFNLTIRNGLGIERSVAAAWMTKFRQVGEKHGIRNIMDDKTKQYRYWLDSQSFIEKETAE
jgi:hypothetical protein